MKKQNPALQYGLIGAFILIICTILSQMYIMSYLRRHVDDPSGFSLFTFAGISILTFVVVIGVFIFCIVKTMRSYRKINPAFTYGKLVGQGLLTTLIIAVVSLIFGILYNKVIDPNAQKKSLEMMETIFENINMPNKDQVLDRMRNQNPTRQAITGLSVTLVVGMIISFISAGVLNRKPEEFSNNPNELR
jgi:hypothetical protein